MNGTVKVWKRRLRSEFGDDRIDFRWNPEIERFQVGYHKPLGASDSVEWFYTLTDGHNGFRPPDQRMIRKLQILDKNHQPNWTPQRYRKFLEDEKNDVRRKNGAEFRYEVLHELKFRKGRFWEAAR